MVLGYAVGRVECALPSRGYCVVDVVGGVGVDQIGGGRADGRIH